MTKMIDDFDYVDNHDDHNQGFDNRDDYGYVDNHDSNDIITMMTMMILIMFVIMT